jgi:hypothetical protein
MDDVECIKLGEESSGWLIFRSLMRPTSTAKTITYRWYLKMISYERLQGMGKKMVKLFLCFN